MKIGNTTYQGRVGRESACHSGKWTDHWNEKYKLPMEREKDKGNFALANVSSLHPEGFHWTDV